MDTKTIDECFALSLAGKITFPEVVMKLAANGTERYITDLVGLRKLAFGKNGQAHTIELDFDAKKIGTNFDTATIQSTIKQIQQGQINYPTFLHQIMEAGCCHYEVFIDGRKAIYFGRDGSQHIEPFPQAA